MLDAPPLDPCLAADLDPQGGLQILGQVALASDCSISTKVVKDSARNCQVILDFQNRREQWVIAGADDMQVEENRLVVLEDQASEPFCVPCRHSLVQASQGQVMLSGRPLWCRPAHSRRAEATS